MNQLLTEDDLFRLIGYHVAKAEMLERWLRDRDHTILEKDGLIRDLQGKLEELEGNFPEGLTNE